MGTIYDFITGSADGAFGRSAAMWALQEDFERGAAHP